VVAAPYVPEPEAVALSSAILKVLPVEAVKLCTAFRISTLKLVGIAVVMLIGISVLQ
jgi:hypothetical protein